MAKPFKPFILVIYKVEFGIEVFNKNHNRFKSRLRVLKEWQNLRNPTISITLKAIGKTGRIKQKGAFHLHKIIRRITLFPYLLYILYHSL